MIDFGSHSYQSCYCVNSYTIKAITPHCYWTIWDTLEEGLDNQLGGLRLVTWNFLAKFSKWSPRNGIFLEQYCLFHRVSSGNIHAIM